MQLLYYVFKKTFMICHQLPYFEQWQLANGNVGDCLEISSTIGLQVRACKYFNRKRQLHRKFLPILLKLKSLVL